MRENESKYGGIRGERKRERERGGGGRTRFHISSKVNQVMEIFFIYFYLIIYQLD